MIRFFSKAQKKKITERLTLPTLVVKSIQMQLRRDGQNLKLTSVLQKNIRSPESMCFSSEHKRSVHGGMLQHEVIYSQHLLALGSASRPT